MKVVKEKLGFVSAFVTGVWYNISRTMEENGICRFVMLLRA